MTKPISVAEFSITRLKPDAPRCIQPGKIGRAAAHEVEIPFVCRAPLNGWGPFWVRHDRLAVEFDKHLMLRALVLEDPLGKRVAIVVADLHGGSRYVSEEAARRLASDGFGPHNLIFSGTHCHSGPGGVYASPYYDSLGSSIGLHLGNVDLRQGFARDLADELVRLTVDSVKACVNRLAPASVGWAVGRLGHQYLTNRSSDAFMKNSYSDRLALAQSTNGGVVRGRPEVETRLPTIVAVSNETQKPIAVFATCSAHNALLAREHAVWSPDIFGYAVDKVRADEAHREAIVAIAAGAIGDCDPTLPTQDLQQLLAARRESLESNLKLIGDHSTHVAAAIIEAARAAATRAHPLLGVNIRGHEIDVGVAADCVDAKGRALAMPTVARVGSSTVAGSELGTGDMLGVEFSEKDGVTEDGETESAHWPKRLKPTGSLGHAYAENTALTIAAQFMDHQHRKLGLRFVELTFGDGFPPVRMLAVPGEPTTMMTHQLTQQLCASAPENCLGIVVAVAGDYCGYFATEPEYLEQHYEGSSTIWGRNTAALLTSWAGRLATEEKYEQPWSGDTKFKFEEETYRVTFFNNDQGSRLGFWASEALTEEEARRRFKAIMK